MNSLHRSFEEKRNFIRMKVNTPAEITLEGQGTVQSGVCNDLSSGGMLLTTDNQLPIDSELLITVRSRHGHSPTLKARCRVARVEDGPGEQCIVGVEISEFLE